MVVNKKIENIEITLIKIEILFLTFYERSCRKDMTPDIKLTGTIYGL